MKLDVSPEIRTNALLSALVDAAGASLENMIGPPADEMVASWGLHSDADRGSTVITLALQDANRWCRTTFGIHEFQDPDHIRARFERMWEELLDQGPKSRIMRTLPAEFFSVPQGTWCG